MTANRTWLGINSGSPVFRVSKAGVDVKTASDANLLFDYQMRSFQKIASGYFEVSGKNVAATTRTIAVPTGATSLIVWCFYKKIASTSQYYNYDSWYWNPYISSTQLRAWHISDGYIGVYIEPLDNTSTDTDAYTWILTNLEIDP